MFCSSPVRASSASSRDLPIPASPESSSAPPSPVRTRSSRASSCWNPASRPTSAASRRAAAARGGRRGPRRRLGALAGSSRNNRSLASAIASGWRSAASLPSAAEEPRAAVVERHRRARAAPAAREDGVQRRRPVPRRKGWTPVSTVEHRREREQIAQRASIISPMRLLGATCMQHADQRAGVGQRAVAGGARGAEVGELGVASRGGNGMLSGLDVAMDHALEVGDRERPHSAVPSRTTSASGRGLRSSRWRRVSPGTYSITTQASSSAEPTS